MSTSVPLNDPLNVREVKLAKFPQLDRLSLIVIPVLVEAVLILIPIKDLIFPQAFGSDPMIKGDYLHGRKDQVLKKCSKPLT